MKLKKIQAVCILRYTLAITFIWFGILKLLGISPVLLLIDNAMPHFLLQIPFFMQTLSIAEIVIGCGLLFTQTKKYAAIGMIMHLVVATLSVYITQGFSGNPLILTMAGEFVVKNLILIASGLVVLAE
jgi:uncharacterized membrane protein YphA (DoxX/SURF4 family)